jgi:hypothetical protein
MPKGVAMMQKSRASRRHQPDAGEEGDVGDALLAAGDIAAT